jgi:hypothetical protein
MEIKDKDWNFFRIIKDVISDNKTIIWCQQNGLLPTNKNCDNCGQNMKQSFTKSGKLVFRCNKRLCRNKPGIKKSGTVNTWFNEHRISIQSIIAITYFFTTNCNNFNSIQKECSKITNEKVLSSNTISGI